MRIIFNAATTTALRCAKGTPGAAARSSWHFLLRARARVPLSIGIFLLKTSGFYLVPFFFVSS